MTTCPLWLSAQPIGYRQCDSLRLTVRFDNTTIFDNILTDGLIKIQHEFVEKDDVQHTLEIEMSGKTQNDTVVDAHGNIIDDRLIEISSLNLGDIDIGQLFFDFSEYHHDFNGTADPLCDKFAGIMGCNGIVKFKFSSPAYLWLLENM
jgi:hypothetical protein